MVTDGKKERLVAVGRVKIEKRPFKKIILDKGISATLQNADSVFIMGKETPVHFMEVQEKTEIAYMKAESFARHKGEVIEEEIEER